MILSAVHDHDESTKESIRKLQMKRDSSEITEDEYEERYEEIMAYYRSEFLKILHAI